MLDNEPISKGVLLLLKYTYHPIGYFCPPPPAHGGTYRLEYSATQYKGGDPVPGTEEWRAFLTDENLTTIRRFKTVGELNHFHKGMYGSYLY
jgi:hypothetical protein